MTGFKNLIMRENVVQLAVAVVIGTQVSDLVKQFVQPFIDPLGRPAWICSTSTHAEPGRGCWGRTCLSPSVTSSGEAELCGGVAGRRPPWRLSRGGAASRPAPRH